MHGRERSSNSFLREWPLLVLLLTAAGFLVSGGQVAEAGTGTAAVALGILLPVILLSAFSVVKHAESLAIKVGEPLGTLILTLSVTGLEVMLISAAMFMGKSQPQLARDTMFAVVMIILGGMVGMSLLLGAWRHSQQVYNLQGASAFMAVILPVATIGLILPNFLKSSPGPTFSTGQAIVLILLLLGLYAVFLGIQNARHQQFFISPDEGERTLYDEDHEAGPVKYHAAFLAAYLLPLIFLCKQLALPLERVISAASAPPALAGFIIAVLVLSPESVSAIKAARRNRLQKSVNLLLGSVLATIGLTIPSVLLIGLISGKSIILGLDPAGITLLALILILSMHTFSTRRTNIVLGVVHLVVFAAYLMLLFD